MKNARRLLASLAVVASLLSARAEALEPVRVLVSDIDDTLKISDVGSPIGAIAHAIQLEAFPGMPELFRELAGEHPEMAIHYVSLAPHALFHGLHEEFLEENNFPAGALHMPSLLGRSHFKEDEIAKILSSVEPGLVILVGDNTMQDAASYATIRKEFEPRGFRFLIYIHAIKPEPGSAFVRTEMTKELKYHDASDLAADLTKLNALETETRP